MDNIIEVSKLNKAFKDKKVLNDISFNIRGGKILAYLGHNGAGKTTTVRILLGLLSKTSGSIKFNGREIDYDSKDFDDMRKGFGIMLDYPAFYNELSAAENLRIFASLYSVNKEDFEPRLNYFAEKLEIKDALKSKVKTFSRGMRQKISFIRAIIHNPEIVFMDEPMSGLDPVARIKMRDIIIELREKNKTSFLITSHDLEEMDKISDYIIILEKGNVVLSGALDEIKSSGINYTISLDKDISSDILEKVKKGFEVESISSDKGLLSFMSKKELTISDIFEFFSRENYKIINIDKKENSLEKIYFDMVSRNEKK
ncbi:MAG: ABC transporter ATP-binding protein [Elusimicrobia bacterium]|nr:ABC transporter ATP-binding protein [Elusimicrobiota bacterium]